MMYDTHRYSYKILMFDGWRWIVGPEGVYKKGHHGIEIPSWILLDAIMYNDNNMYWLELSKSKKKID